MGDLLAASAAATLAVIAWSLYSSRKRKALRQAEFATMQILSETRETYGDASRIPELARRLSRRTMGESFRHIAGDAFGGEGDGRRGSVRIKGDVAFEYSKEDDGKWAIYGRRKPGTLSLRELVSQKSTKMEIEEDIFKRMNWSERMRECLPLNGDKQNNAAAVRGPYCFCHRDYVNHEELMGMMWKRGGIEGFLFKPSRADQVLVGEDGECTLRAKSRLFWLVPISITWEGKLKEGFIHWHTSSLMLGWEAFGKFFDKPAAAERLRKDPWRVTVPRDDPTGDILCFEREGKGHLVFAREECLSKGHKSE